MNVRVLAALLLACVLPAADAATLTLVPTDPAVGVPHGFDDPTVVAPEGGNSGTTLGQQRRNLFNAAAAAWGAALASDFEIKIEANFAPLPCQFDRAVMGSAGPTTFFPVGTAGDEHWYAVALAETVAGQNLNGAAAEIAASFNSGIDIDDPNCLGATRFYYGLSGPVPAGTVALYPVVLHEIAHGLGFLSFFCNPGFSDCGGAPLGGLFGGFPDMWVENLYDTESNKFYVDMTDAERIASYTNAPDVVWFGSKVSGHLPDFGQSGTALSEGKMRIYAPFPFEGGSSMVHFDETALPNLLMEPLADDDVFAQTDLTDCLFADIGWINNRCIDRAPTLDAIANQAPIIEDSTNKVVNLSGIDDSDNDTQTITITATSDTPSLVPDPLVIYTSPNATGLVVYQPAANQNGTATITVTATDSGDTDGGGLNSRARSFTVTVTPVNDPPTATNRTAPETYTEDTPLNLVDIVAGDVDSTDITATLTLSIAAAGSFNTGVSGPVTSTFNAGSGVWTAAGPIANVNVLLAGLVFTPAANSTLQFTVATQVSDGALAVSGTKAFTPVAVNDPPAASNLSAPQTFTEEVSLNLTDIVISDIDSANASATLTLSSPAAGALTTSTSGFSASTFDPVTGVWAAIGPIANVNTLLANVSFVPAPNFSSNFSIATSASDTVATPLTGSKAMSAIGVNDAPSLTAPASATIIENSVRAFTGVDLISVADPDAAPVQIGLDVSNGTLTLGTRTGLSFFGSDGIADDVIVCAGSIAQLNTALATLTFTPTTNFNGNAQLLVGAQDGVSPAVFKSVALTVVKLAILRDGFEGN